MDKQQIEQLIAQRLSQHRPAAWEDDISRNADDNLPFENLPRAIELLGKQKRYGNTELSDQELTVFAERDLAPLPGFADREGYGAKKDLSYWISGLNDYLRVTQRIKQMDLAVNRMLDFGCASGRVIRHFAAQSEIAEIWGTDINARHIRWLCEFMPRTVKPIANYCLPQLPIADNYFDLITGFSVFTHIDTFELAWLAELKRVLNDQGILYVTIHNEDTWDILREDIDNDGNRLVKTMIELEPETRELLLSPMPEGRHVYRLTDRGPYRSQVFHSNSYIENVWGRFFEIVEILPRHHVRQTVVIMRQHDG